MAEVGAGSLRSLRPLARALALAQHVLVRDPEQLPAQLAARLRREHGPPAGYVGPSGTWLRPLPETLGTADGLRGRVLVGHDRPVTALVALPDARGLASASRGDRTVRIWDLDRGLETALVTLGGTPGAMAAGPDGTIAVAVDEHIELLAGSSLERAGTRECGDATVALAWSPDGRLLAAGTGSGAVLLWDLPTGGRPRRLADHVEAVTGVAFTPDGRRLVSASRDRTVRVWSAPSGEVEAALESTSPQHCVAIAPDGRRAVTGSAMVPILWDLDELKQERILTGFDGPFHAGDVDAVCFTPEGDRLLSAGLELLVWRTDFGGDPTHGVGAPLEWTGHGGTVTQLVVTPDGSWAASASSDCTIRLWNLRGQGGARLAQTTESAGKSVYPAEGDPVEWIGFGSAGEVLWLTVRYEDMMDGAEWASALRSRGGPEIDRDWYGRVVGVTQSADRRRLDVDLGYGNTDSVEVADAGGRRSAPRALSSSEELLLADLAPPPLRVCWNDSVLVAVFERGALRVWDRRTLEELAGLPDGSVRTRGVPHVNLPGNPVAAFSLARDVDWAATGQGDTVALWDVRSGGRLAAFTVDDSVEACVLSDDGRMLAAGTDAGGVHLLEVVDDR